MKTAKEMFEELGYEYIHLVKTILYDDDVYYYKNELNPRSDYNRIWFFLNKQEYSINKLFMGSSAYIDIKLHHAIHQQMKELGWIE